MSDIVEWHGLYAAKWNDLLSPGAVSHPAKFSHGLIRRIYEYALEQGYLTVDSKVLDPFGGVGLGSFYAVNNGLIWLGNELEDKFYKDAYKNFALWCERFWCVCDDPEYLNLLRQYATKPDEESLQLNLFSAQEEANPDDLLELIKVHALVSWDKPNKGNYCLNCGKLVVAYPVLLKGDSRWLTSIIQEQVGGVVSSPPFNDSLAHKTNANDTTNLGIATDGSKRGGSFVKGDYGDSPAQLGNMPAGQLDSVVGSPPYANEGLGHDSGHPRLDAVEDKRRRDEGSNRRSGYGTTDNQLGSLKEGSLDSIISSSPFADSIGSDDPDKRGGLFTSDPKRRNDKNLTGSYGDSDGQLGKLKDEGFDASIGSPPFAQAQTGGGISAAMRGESDYSVTTNLPGNLYQPSEQGESSGQLANLPDKGFDMSVGSPPFVGSGLDDNENRGVRTGKNTQVVRTNRPANIAPGEKARSITYGKSAGQLGAMSEGQLDASISSPSFAGNTGGRGEASRNGIDPALFDRSSGGMKRGTGDSEDNLDHLSMTGFEDAVGGLDTSPPYEELDLGGGGGILKRDTQLQKSYNLKDGNYSVKGNTDNQLGNSTGSTFWQAAKDILTQCWLLLKPGAYSFWVLKAYIKNGKIVDFPGQWLRLCEVCGFEHVETIIAWQTEDKGTNYDLDGGEKKKVVRRQSFFRLLHIKNHPELAIDSEIVLVMRKHL